MRPSRRPGGGTPSCWLPPVPALTSLRISNIEAGYSRKLYRIWRAVPNPLYLPRRLPSRFSFQRRFLLPPNRIRSRIRLLPLRLLRLKGPLFRPQRSRKWWSEPLSRNGFSSRRCLPNRKRFLCPGSLTFPLPHQSRPPPCWMHPRLHAEPSPAKVRPSLKRQNRSRPRPKGNPPDPSLPKPGLEILERKKSTNGGRGEGNVLCRGICLRTDFFSARLWCWFSSEC